MDSKKFAELFKNIKCNHIIPWKDSESIGISIVKDYPKDIDFIPAVDKKGRTDSVALIKIGYDRKEAVEKEKVPLTIKILKASKYYFKEDFADPTKDNCPTRESLETSKKSKQPIDLEDTSKFLFDQKLNKFYDTKSGRYIDTSYIFNYIYQAHLKTLKDKVFQFKIKFKEIILRLVESTNKILEKINSSCFGKTIKKKNPFSGYLSPYTRDEYVHISHDSYKTKIFGTDFPVSYQTAKTFIFFVFVLFITNYYFHYDFIGFVKLFESAKTNSIFLVSLVSILILFFDNVVPFLIFLLINQLIKLKYYLLTLKININ